MTETQTSAGVGVLTGIVLDCPDPLALARFYSELTGWPVGEGSDDEWAGIVGPSDAHLMFQRVGEYVAPNWPGTDPPQQFHLDFDVDDLDEGEAKVLALGATKADHQPGETFRVFVDPTGHPFCLCIGD